MSEWKLCKKLQESNKRGLIIGIAIGLVVCLVIAAIIVKLFCLKKKWDCCTYYDLDECECDFEDAEDCECDENGCTYTTDNDFV